MNIKPRELFNTVSGTTDHSEDSTLLFVIVVILLAVFVYLFIQHVIPVISKVICDFLIHSINTAGGRFQ
jgi:hypothetical protein